MPLTPLDRAFLTDMTTTNWMHHFIVAAALTRTGAEVPGDEANLVLTSLVERHNLVRNRIFLGREPLLVTDTLAAQVQSIAMLRIFQERIAAFESLGVLLVALVQRESLGIAQSHYEHTPRQISALFERIAKASSTDLWDLLDWPDSNGPMTGSAAGFIERYRRLLPWYGARVLEVARAYLRPEQLSLGTLGHIEGTYDPRSSVFVILYHENRWKEGRELDPRLIIKAYNMVKHGFNATAVFKEYEAAAAAGPTAIVLEIPRSNTVVQQFGQEIDLASVLSRELARMALDLDDAGLLS